MTTMRRCAGICILFVLGNSSALGQMTTSQPATAATNTTPAAAEQPAGPAWAFSASAYTYFPPESENYVQPTIRADRGWLHLEARYNYEALDTGSAWIGYNFSVGDKLRLDITPMLGGVFGETNGYAPGYEFTLSWRKLQLYSEGEYVVDTGDSSNNFFYTWSELTLAPVDWFQFGLVVQRTKAYQTDLDIQRGLLMRFSYKKLDLSAYVFNPDTDTPTYVLAVSVSF
jgi:hypothetical protein